MSVAEFRQEMRAWLSDNCPAEIRGRRIGFTGGSKQPITEPGFQGWFDACYERGLTVPSWPKEYGGAALDESQERILRQEMATIGAPAPLAGMGVAMIGPTLLEYGTDEQKQRHLPAISRGDVMWCQGYSEPGAGSDLASLQTRAVDSGDYYLINGSKIWTSGADQADWIFCLVRTDPDVPKHEGISFVLFSMDDPGVSVKPIVLINGNSPFCECFFDDVKAYKADLIGQQNRGWTIAKRLLQYERSFISDGGAISATTPLPELAQQYLGEAMDPARRDEITSIEMDAAAFEYTRQRAKEESREAGTPTFATSMFKYYITEISRRRMECSISILGTQGVGWEGDAFKAPELRTTRNWLYGKAMTIAGGSSEVQLNIISKRVLGLPD